MTGHIHRKPAPDGSSEDHVRQRTREHILNTLPSSDPTKTWYEHDSSGTAKNKSPPSTVASQDQWQQSIDDARKVQDSEDDWEDDGDDDHQTLLPVMGGKLRGSIVNGASSSARLDRIIIEDVATNLTATTIPEVMAPEALTHDRLIDEVYRLRQELGETKAELGAMKDALGLVRSSVCHDLDDEYFKMKVTELRYKIRQWCTSNFALKEPSGKKHAIYDFAHLVADYNAYLNSPESRPWLIQARLWDLLMRNIFEGPEKYCYIWVGLRGRRKFYRRDRSSRHMRPLDATIRKGVRPGDSKETSSFFLWRALTYTLLSSKISPSDISEQTNYLLHKIWDSLRIYSTRSSRNSPAKKRLREIIEDAMTLDLDFKRQLADFSFARWYYTDRRGDKRYEQYGYPFGSSRMDDWNDWCHGTVELLLAPALVKKRDSNGTNYEHEPLITIKADVRCRIPKKHYSSSRRSLSVSTTRSKRSSLNWR